MIDEAAWQQTAREALPVMYKLAAGMLTNQADAQDAVQTALMKSWEKRDRVQPDSCRAYLMKILVNECRNIQRHRLRVTPVNDFTLIPAPDSCDDELAEVMDAIRQLPENLRATLMLKVLEDYSDGQAAQVLGIPQALYRSRLHRARTMLRKMLDREVELA